MQNFILDSKNKMNVLLFRIVIDNSKNSYSDFKKKRFIDDCVQKSISSKIGLLRQYKIVIVLKIELTFFENTH